MCRFLAYHGPATNMQDTLLESSYSLVEQSKRARMRFEPINGDGFGMGWFPDHDDPLPGTFVSIEPAWSNRNLRELAAKINSPHFFAHVRDATPGMPVSQANCHPFKQGQWLWMHNGYLGDFSRYRRELLAGLSDRAFNLIQGNTDSEHVFALFLDQIDHDNTPTLTAVVDALHGTIKQLKAITEAEDCQADAHMNFALSNGQIAIYTRYALHAADTPPTLHYQEGSDSKGARLVVASEPLTSDEDWQAVEKNSMLIKCADNALEIRPLDP